MKSATDEEVYRASIITCNKCVDFQIHPPNTRIEANTWSIADTDHIVNQQQREICGITLTQQMRFKKRFSLYMIQLTFCKRHSEFTMISNPLNSVRYNLDNLRCILSAVYPSQFVELVLVTISSQRFLNGWLHISNVKVIYQFTNKVNYT